MGDLVHMLKIAILCLSYRLESRLSMKQVSQGLSSKISDMTDYTLETKLEELIDFRCFIS